MKTSLKLDDFVDKKALEQIYFLQRRELGIINLGGEAEIKCKEEKFILDNLDALYLGKETEDIEFISLNPNNPAVLYGLSTPAHHSYPTKLIKQTDSKKLILGTPENANMRTINQYLHPDIIKTCQLCMGVTHLEPGSVWNTMPAHTHTRRMEVYLYFNIKPSQVVFHFMGEAHETRHIIIRNKQLIFSPSWSIHSGCGTENYSFVWGMAGENQTFDDMDFIDINQLS
uniref:5-dehydro-4-deoxy-D-glucuronate isomerase n=1 Tax=Chelonobacter oris TaxID=505317 RepID=UPI001F1F345E|nr:5-dehydro-4-deoxy-D-glucuronate isomerase [Chelonobacter oris]